MPMNRDQLIQMLANLDTGSLLKALAVNGIHIAPPEGDDVVSQLMNEGSVQERWNDMRVPISKQQTPPISDPSKYLQALEPQSPELFQQPFYPSINVGDQEE